MKRLIYSLVALALAACHPTTEQEAIDREALVTRNNPVLAAADTLASLSVGNGEFAFTADVTGLQTFPESYKNGVPLGTQSQWGWHSFANPENYKPADALKEYDFGRGHKELYSCQFKEPGRQKSASDWLRKNPHRLHLGIIGLEVPDAFLADVTAIDQKLDMWNGEISSRFTLGGQTYDVKTVCHPERDLVATTVTSPAHTGIKLHFPYPTGGHCDDACNWDANDKHRTEIVRQDAQHALLKRTLDATTYYVNLTWEGQAELEPLGTAEKPQGSWPRLSDVA